MDTDDSTTIPSGLDDQLWALLDRPRADRELGIEELCAAYPSYAASIRRFFAELGSLHAPSDTDVEAETVLAPGDRIGPYHLVRVLGQGGFGVVYLAERREPVLQNVALKLIKLGMDSRAIVQRFERERRSLARMQHDAIAKVYDCGTTERGQPYFVMEYIEGQPLTHYCCQRRLSISERLHLFQSVCAGVQHAHSKSVVHRDLKPDNILVAEIDGKPSPKIIDFGLAKVLEERDRASLQLSRNVRLGTPAYMAPEQADPGNEDIDTRADVYALGVILYELLVGELPHAPGDAQRLLAQTFAELETPRPSSKLPMGQDRTQAIAKERQTSAKSLRRLLEQDLDWVVLKAMAKLPADRYPTPQSLSDELQRFLDDEPLHAGPPSWSYRCRKWFRRYRGPVLAAALVLLVLLGGILASSIGFARARRSQIVAEQAQSESIALKDQQILLLEETLHTKEALALSREREIQTTREAEEQLALSRARISIERGLFELVLEEFPVEESLPHSQTGIERALLQIEALDALGRGQEALSIIRDLEAPAKGTPIEARTLLLLGQTAYGRSSAGGRNAFQRSIHLAKKAPDQLERFELTYAEAMTSKDLIEAERLLRECLALRPRYVSAMEALGLILLARGKAPEAAEIANRWMESTPANLNAAMLRFLAESLAGREKEAQDVLTSITTRAPNHAKQLEIMASILKLLEASLLDISQGGLSMMADAFPDPPKLESSKRNIKIDGRRLQLRAQAATKMLREAMPSKANNLIGDLRLPPPLRDRYAPLSTSPRLLAQAALGYGEGAEFPEQYIALNRIVIREGIESPNIKSALDIEGFTSNGKGPALFVSILSFADSIQALNILRLSESSTNGKEAEISIEIRKCGSALLGFKQLTEDDFRDIASIVVNLGCDHRWLFAEEVLSRWQYQFGHSSAWAICRAEILHARGLTSEALQEVETLESSGNQRARLLRERWTK